MSLINIIILRMIEILQDFLNEWGQREKGFKFETEIESKKWRKLVGSSFQRKVGFHNIKQSDLEATIGIPFIYSFCLW
jgi:hypothetical protein